MDKREPDTRGNDGPDPTRRHRRQAREEVTKPEHQLPKEVRMADGRVHARVAPAALASL